MSLENSVLVSTPVKFQQMLTFGETHVLIFSNEWLFLFSAVHLVLLNWSSYKFNSVSVNVSAPVSTKGVLHLPAHGKKDIKVKEGNEIAYNTKEVQMNQCCVFTVGNSD